MNIKLNSIELFMQTETGSLVWNSFLDTISQTKDLNKALTTAAEVSNRYNFTIPFWLMVFLDGLKLSK